MISLAVAGVIDSGGQEDNQIIANLAVVQKLAGQEERIGFCRSQRAAVRRTKLEAAIAKLSARVPGVECRPVPQISHAEGLLLPRIRGLIFFMVALILVLTTLCVFASMAALAMERRRDVGLMKAIGGSMSRIVSDFSDGSWSAWPGGRADRLRRGNFSFALDWRARVSRGHQRAA